ncbi:MULTISPECIES: protein-L-isoaspartate O-methyltransferase [Methylobacterium]|uniref:Protein-L-isoaspartate O-methyltransferase n=1 Tax=Methylobacterium bullatum TaxID=570505 RepID=A0A679KBC2_9HYPH|nr:MULTISPECIES: protein-L-isoaspartate O-methyltransferase [Methylobacterium]MBD8903312.1 protein-L-isoaspartate O-methyltransferase [Methylobacterium bullatum]TXN23409.1 protein-L-isoaspartate O-methyltransferase [Methylobacterium sp. WL19]GJD41177.1 Protein-L-isoaspartate O-methyltransferase [Methylobacterium bullatum]CAA2144359.1 Protein-L-isoaspartate O-methyltransferase [Methylobacterium bullatum]
MLDYAQARRLMVDCQLRTFDVNDIPVLDAFEAVPRERFVPQGREDFAYIDQSLRITGQDPATDRVIPAPMLLARMIQALQLAPGKVALDVATGYGYAAAIMRQLGVRVVALESDDALAAEAESRLSATDGIEIVRGPLPAGAAKAGPFDAILVNGRVETRPQSLLDQLKDGGRLACVMGRDKAAKATLFIRTGDAFGARPLFDASLPALSAFSPESSFSF